MRHHFSQGKKRLSLRNVRFFSFFFQKELVEIADVGIIRMIGCLQEFA